MWPLLQVLDTLLLGATARLQQYDRLVLAISHEIEPVHIRNREQTFLAGYFSRPFWQATLAGLANIVGYFSWASGLQCCHLSTDSYCTTVQNIASLSSMFLQLLLSVFLVDMVL